MRTDIDWATRRSRWQVGRLLTGSLLEMAVKAYGAGAALAVALSDAETVGGKARDAVAAVPTLVEEYREAKYVSDHREEIQEAVDHLSTHSPPRAELEASVDTAAQTLRDIETTNEEIGRLWDGPLWRLDEKYDHARAAWEAKPSLDSLHQLVELAEGVGPLMDRVDVLLPVYYGSFLAVADNFAGDEIAGTVLLIVAALLLAFVLAHVVGFWVRRGRPGLMGLLLLMAGARTFRRWYVDNLPWALGAPVYAAARERVQADIVADPEGALEPEALRTLEAYFRDRRREEPSP